MKTVKIKKLVLNKATIVNLANQELKNARGGATADECSLSIVLCTPDLSILPVICA